MNIMNLYEYKLLVEKNENISRENFGFIRYNIRLTEFRYSQYFSIVSLEAKFRFVPSLPYSLKVKEKFYFNFFFSRFSSVSLYAIHRRIFFIHTRTESTHHRIHRHLKLFRILLHIFRKLNNKIAFSMYFNDLHYTPVQTSSHYTLVYYTHAIRLEFHGGICE